ncbi:5-formyltetrahydrofolate cyclo-ligase [Weissella viridescens]|uniref:5-formyltetrahydrofolate cyclo-ligase n=1 Tax=Weissella viridescens TaxID=1629 RepID=A0A3P2RH38_WEIVI|nr:5-formyltetrahydrofolate cyclo-ligase [Weissella viridescens]RRG18711.1 5-formyltetrahydrofolate cyclo-ligase [Weissella viridescens]
MVDKSKYRAKALIKLASLSDQARAWYLQKMVQQVTVLPEWRNAQVVALTLAQADELPTELLIQTALLQGKTVLLPKVQLNYQMDFIPVDIETKYARHKFGMLEPIGQPFTELDKIDFVLVPGLAFSEDGQRLGFGGGYYDRWLPKVTAPKVAVTLAENYYPQAQWPVESTDYRLDQIIVLDGYHEK